MKKFLNKIKNYYPDRGNVIIYLSALFLNLTIWVFMSYIKKPDNMSLPLHYNIYQGIDLFDVWSRLYIIPIIGLLFVTINFILTMYILKKDKLMAYFLSSSSILIQLILITAIFWIFYLQQELFD